MSKHITEDKDGSFNYQCINCGELKDDTEFESSGMSEVCLSCSAIEFSFRDKLQAVYGAMLEENGIAYGDIAPEQLIRLEDAEKQLAKVVASWIISGKEF